MDESEGSESLLAGEELCHQDRVVGCLLRSLPGGSHSEHGGIKLSSLVWCRRQPKKLMLHQSR